MKRLDIIRLNTLAAANIGGLAFRNLCPVAP